MKIDSDKLLSLNQKLAVIKSEMSLSPDSDEIGSSFYAHVMLDCERLTRDSVVNACREAKKKMDAHIDQFCYILLKELF